ncbi:hypothetical protein CDEST_06940 [Colletotrichum destructivum]|uniref:Small secreted protein n=1 Tax=Colletotrichum destructivum TaxID=34406 RepID=A0AAX4IG52_9PEZI|nr:hypothetical protein CDEST_06940 [Colletotrichum destructivum]
MHYSQLILSLFCVFTFVNALPVPAQGEAVVARATKKGNTKAETAGIKQNINIQKEEKKDAKGVAKAKNPNEFKKAKGELVNTIEDGKKVREKNQKNADPKNKKLNDGLKKVQGAQAVEEKQAKGLKGNTSKADKATLKTLQGEFSKGIDVNKGNLKAAKEGSKKTNTGKKGN